MEQLFIVNGRNDRQTLLPKEKMIWLLRQLADGIENDILGYASSYWYWKEEEGQLIEATLDGEIVAIDIAKEWGMLEAPLAEEEEMDSMRVGYSHTFNGVAEFCNGEQIDDQNRLVPCFGELKDFCIQVLNMPKEVKGYRYELYCNGVKTPVMLEVTKDNPTSKDDSHSLHLSAADIIKWEITEL